MSELDTNEGSMGQDVEVAVPETAVSRDGRKTRGKPSDTLDPSVLGDVEVQLTAVLGRGHISVGQLLSLSSGSLIELDTPLDGSVDIRLNNRIVARGEIVAVDDRFGVRITQIAPTTD